MKILQLKAENFLRLRAVEINPKGEVIKISGANGQGKTSVLDSIWAVLDHSRLNAEQPIHKGAKKAVIRLNLGEFTVQRVITGKSSELTVTASDGVKVAKPQQFLDALVGELSFDPLAFDRMKPAEQLDQLKAMLKLDFSEADRANEADFGKRAELNKQAKAKRAEAEGSPWVPPDLVKVDEAAIIERIDTAAAHNEKLSLRREKRQSVKQNAEALESHAARLRERKLKLLDEIAQVDKDIAEADREATESRERLAGAAELPAPIDVSAETAELQRARDVNARVEQRERRMALEAQAEQLEAQAEALTGQMDIRNDGKAEAIAKANLPVPGLGFGEGMVTYNALPYAQASAAERLQVSMAIAMRANPKIRVIRISDGSLLDSKSMAIVGQLAKENDFQVWVEVVDESKKIGIVIEDGAVAAVNE